ncbi:DUF4192 domain-containing protein [Nonomuraea sp. NPDC049607]|uniref:DUF4192 domain-containing protein n=1 Tax=Nonomuraea sp. NPDC049607 TaxID=3154732 RepID=UPI003420EFD9
MSTASDHTHAITIRKLADVVAIVPYLLGFHPSKSLVAVVVDDEKLKGVVRLDLTQDSAEMAERTAYLVKVLEGNDIRETLLLGYGSGSNVTPMMDAAMAAVRGAGIVLAEAIRVDDGRYWSYICGDVACCPPDGVPVDLSCSAPAAAAVVAGRHAFPDRAALVASLDPPQGFDQHHAESVTREVCSQAKEVSKAGGEWFAEGVQRVVAALDRVQAGDDLDLEGVAWLGVCLTAKPVRDMAMTFVQQYGIETHVCLWTEVTRKVPSAFAAGPATLLAFTAMCQGYGPLASIALERALSVNPRYSLALLLIEGLMVGLSPSEVLARDWNELADEITEQVRECPSTAWPLLPEGW